MEGSTRRPCSTIERYAWVTPSLPAASCCVQPSRNLASLSSWPFISNLDSLCHKEEILSLENITQSVITGNRLFTFCPPHSPAQRPPPKQFNPHPFFLT